MFTYWGKTLKPKLLFLSTLEIAAILIPHHCLKLVRPREGGDNGLFITLVPKVFENRFFFNSLTLHL